MSYRAILTKKFEQLIFEGRCSSSDQIPRWEYDWDAFLEIRSSSFGV